MNLKSYKTKTNSVWVSKPSLFVGLNPFLYSSAMPLNVIKLGMKMILYVAFFRKLWYD